MAQGGAARARAAAGAPQGARPSRRQAGSQASRRSKGNREQHTAAHLHPLTVTGMGTERCAPTGIRLCGSSGSRGARPALGSAAVAEAAAAWARHGSQHGRECPARQLAPNPAHLCSLRRRGGLARDRRRAAEPRAGRGDHGAAGARQPHLKVGQGGVGVQLEHLGWHGGAAEGGWGARWSDRRSMDGWQAGQAQLAKHAWVQARFAHAKVFSAN